MVGKELEKEAKEYAHQASEILVDNTDAFITSEEYLEKGYLAGAEPREKRIAELEKQIETKDIQIKELQEQKCYWKESSFDWRHKFFKLDKVKRLIKKDKQLTKAIELLKWALHSDPEHDNLVDFDTKWKEAEQFLKECE